MLLRPNNDYEGQTVELDEDGKAVALRELREEIFANTTLADFIGSDEPVDKQTAYSILHVKESRLATLCKLLGIELDSANERAKRYAGIRQANERIHELERELGATGSPEQTSAHIARLSDKLEHWWDSEGFGHISDISFTRHGVRLTLSCLVMHAPGLWSSKPVSEKEAMQEWLRLLAERGFVFVSLRGEREPSVADNDCNRKLLQEMVLAAFPTARIVQTTNHFDPVAGFVLRDLTVHIYKLEEIEALPARPARA